MKTPNNSEFFRGHIDTIILKSLYEGDRYGYDIIKEIDERSGGKYKVKQATLYSCLRRLEDQGFLSSYWGEKTSGGRKRYYTLTKMGKEVFLKQQTDWKKSKDIIDSLVYGSSDEIDFESFNDENDEFQGDERFMFDEPEIPAPAQEELKDNFERIFGMPKPERSYVDSVVNQAYKSPENKADFGLSTQEKNLKSDEGQNDYYFLEPNPPKVKEEPLSDAERQIKLKAQQILNEAKSQQQINIIPIPEMQKKKEVEFIKYNDENNERIITDAEIISRDYQQALTKLTKNLKRTQPQRESVSAQSQQEKKLEDVRREAVRSGDSVIIRHHDNAMKQYNSENFYYRNRLMLVQYGIMFIFMLIQIVTVFTVFELTLKQAPISTRDLWIYISAVLIALSLPIFAFICSFKDYFRRKQREKSFRNSFIFRFIILAQLWVIIVAINVYNYRDFIESDLSKYSATFILPATLAFNIVWSSIIHILLLKTNKFNV